MRLKLIKILATIVILFIVGFIVYFVHNYIKHPERSYLEIEDTRTIRLPLQKDEMILMSVPKNAKLVGCDGITMFVYQTPDGRKWIIQKTLTTNYEGDNTLKGSSLDNTSVTHNYGKFSYIVQNKEKYLKNAVIDFTAPTVEPTYHLLSENKAPALPTVSANDAVMSTIGVLNPPNYKQSVLLAATANITADGSSFFTAYQQMGDIDSIMEEQLSWLAAMDPDYDPDKIKWFIDDLTWFAISNDYCVGARGLTDNNWTMYYCTKDYMDYIVKNLSVPHTKNK